MLLKDKMICIKDVVMDDGTKAFSKGKTYKTNRQSLYLNSINNQKVKHCLGRLHDEDKWFHHHFKLVN